MSDRLLKESDVLKAIDKRVEELSKDPVFIRKNGIIDIMGVKKHILAIPSPQRDCFLCKWLGDVDVCGRCRNRNLFAEADTEPTISKMEQVDKDINVRSKTEPSNSEKPNNCEHITEDGVTCVKYPACDDCLDNPLNKVKGSERLVKGSEQTEPTTQAETQNSNLTFEKRTMRDCYNCKRYEAEGECIECHYEPKDEPQTERSE